MFFPEHHNRAILSPMIPSNQVEHWLIRVFRQRSAVQKPVEQLGGGFRRGSTEHENAAGIFIKMEQSGLLYIRQEFQSSVPVGVKQFVNSALEWHQALRTRLEMHVVRSRRPALRAVVEPKIFIVLLDEIEKILITVPD